MQLPEKQKMLILCSRNTSLALNVAQDFSAETTQSAIQKLTLHQQKIVRHTHVPLKTQNRMYSGLENK